MVLRSVFDVGLGAPSKKKEPVLLACKSFCRLDATLESFLLCTSRWLRVVELTLCFCSGKRNLLPLRCVYEDWQGHPCAYLSRRRSYTEASRRTHSFSFAPVLNLALTPNFTVHSQILAHIVCSRSADRDCTIKLRFFFPCWRVLTTSLILACAYACTTAMTRIISEKCVL